MRNKNQAEFWLNQKAVIFTERCYFLFM